MKKFICISCLLVVGGLAGCSAADVTETYTLTSELDGVKTEEKIILYGKDDDTLEKSEEHMTFTFDGSEVALAQWEEIEGLVNAYVPETKYITIDKSETESSITVKTTTDFKQAMSDKAVVYTDEIYDSNEYYSMENTAKQYLSEGYTLVVDK